LHCNFAFLLFCAPIQNMCVLVLNLIRHEPFAKKKRFQKTSHER
jgi:hypothetical protein